MTTPDASALNRKTYKLVIEDYKPGDAMVVASLTVPGRVQPAKFMGEPEVLEQLVTALDPAPIVAQVLALAQWAASAMENNGQATEAVAVRRFAAWVSGEVSSPVEAVTEPMLCSAVINDRPCGRGDAREHVQCGKRYCVSHWHNGEAHACQAGRVRREVPPPLVPVPNTAPEPSYR